MTTVPCPDCSTPSACTVAMPRPCGRPRVSLVAGALSRSVLDAARAQSPRLAELWGRPVDQPVVLDAGPWDD